MRINVKTNFKSKIAFWIEIIIGTFFMSVAYKCIYDSVSMVTGGFSGIGVIVRHLTMGIVEDGIPMWVTNIVLNVPLFIVSYFVVGKKFVWQTLIGTASMTFFLGILPSVYVEEADYFISAVMGGVLYGVGVGLVLRRGTSTGGTDMLAVVISKFMKGYSVVKIMQVLDWLIVIMGFLIFGVRVSVYALIAIFIGTMISDRVIVGAQDAKAVWIISDKYQEIASRLMSEVDRGVTAFDATGMYYNTRKNVILCVVFKKQIPKVKEIALEVDENVFLVIGDVREVCGEGFVQN